MASKPTGRPRGRPKGSVSKRREEIRSLIEDAAPELIQKLIEAAKAGDSSAATALLDRVAPKLRPTAMAVCVDLSGSPEEVGKRLLAAVGEGSIPVDIAHELAALAARATSPSEAVKPIDYEALDRIYAQKMAEMRARDEQFRTRRAEDLRAMGVPESELSPFIRGQHEQQ